MVVINDHNKIPNIIKIMGIEVNLAKNAQNKSSTKFSKSLQ